MPSVYDTLYSWARRTSTSFAELRFVASEREQLEQDGDGLIYRLRHWPELPASSRTAHVYRTLSMMSTRPVNRHWLLSHSKLPAQQVDRLLQRLVADGAVEVIDTSNFGPDSN
jgi:hypothetical protein